MLLRFSDVDSLFIEQLLEEFYRNTSIVDKLLSYRVHIIGSNVYWFKRINELEPMCSSLGSLIIFLTLSASDLRWLHLQWHLRLNNLVFCLWTWNNVKEDSKSIKGQSLYFLRIFCNTCWSLLWSFKNMQSEVNQLCYHIKNFSPRFFSHVAAQIATEAFNVHLLKLFISGIWLLLKSWDGFRKKHCFTIP